MKSDYMETNQETFNEKSFADIRVWKNVCIAVIGENILLSY